MRPVVMPDGWFPGCERHVIGGENGTEPAMYVVEPDPDYRVKVTTLVQLDPDEVEQIAANGHVFLTMWGGELPWNIRPVVATTSVDLSPANPWAYCACGHPWMLHDIEEMGDPSPTCCAASCAQNCAEREPGSPIPNGKGY